MKHKIFAIFDSKAHAYLPPFTMHQEAMALRVFTDTINDPVHAFGKHPADYTLFNIGAYDDNTAKITANSPISLANGIELVQKSSDPAQLELVEESA